MESLAGKQISSQRFTASHLVPPAAPSLKDQEVINLSRLTAQGICLIPVTISTVKVSPRIKHTEESLSECDDGDDTVSMLKSR